MSEKKVQITFIVSADEAEALEKMSDADKALLTETLTASIRQKLQERVLLKAGDQVNESKDAKMTRLDEVMGNITPGLEE